MFFLIDYKKWWIISHIQIMLGIGNESSTSLQNHANMIMKIIKSLDLQKVFIPGQIHKIF